jgi:putative membrane protein
MMDKNLLRPVLQKNDKKASLLIFVFSFVVFAAVVLLGRFKLNVNAGFDVNIFATINAVINTIVALLLIAALIAVKNGNYQSHKKMMLAALALSVLFLLSYITHRLLSGDAVFGDSNHDGILSDDERSAVGSLRTAYLILLATHIFLAGVILPFILFTAYRALTAEFPLHKKLAKYTWPLWLYVAVTGPIVYFMIKPYYR